MNWNVAVSGHLRGFAGRLCAIALVGALVVLGLASCATPDGSTAGGSGGCWCSVGRAVSAVAKKWPGTENDGEAVANALGAERERMVGWSTSSSVS